MTVGINPSLKTRAITFKPPYTERLSSLNVVKDLRLFFPLWGKRRSFQMRFRCLQNPVGFTVSPPGV
jgi:hypothetical protein